MDQTLRDGTGPGKPLAKQHSAPWYRDLVPLNGQHFFQSKEAQWLRGSSVFDNSSRVELETAAESNDHPAARQCAVYLRAAEKIASALTQWVEEQLGGSMWITIGS